MHRVLIALDLNVTRHAEVDFGEDELVQWVRNTLLEHFPPRTDLRRKGALAVPFSSANELTISVVKSICYKIPQGPGTFAIQGDRVLFYPEGEAEGEAKG